MSKDDGLLTREQMFDPKGCGAGTSKACFALTMTAAGIECLLVTNLEVAQLAGGSLDWRINVDEEDGLAWCPLGVLDNSKQAPEQDPDTAA